MAGSEYGRAFIYCSSSGELSCFYSLFRLFIFHKIYNTINSLDLFTCMCVKSSASPSTVDSRTGSNIPSKETAKTYLQKYFTI